jgi:Zn-dependent protease
MPTSRNHSLFLILAFIIIFFSGNHLQQLLANPIDSLIFLSCLLIALVLHEFCHALAADLLGDPNPRIAGRLSLNPLKHLDPLGTLLIVLAGFGWGKPVAFDPYNLKNPAQDGALIAAAGPLSNLLLATICALLLRFLPFSTAFPFASTIILFIFTLFSLNLSLAIFNLIPIYPLDGHHILRSFFPPRLRASYDLLNRHYGMIIAFLLIVPIFTPRAPATYLIEPTVNFASQLLLGI